MSSTPVDALARGGAITAERKNAILAGIRRDRLLPAIGALNEILEDYYDPQGRLTALFTSMFAHGPVESGAVNALRMLVALDILMAHTLDVSQLDELSDDFRRYLQTFRDRAEDRRALAARFGQAIRNRPR